MDLKVITTRLPRELHAAIGNIAHQRRVSVNQLIIDYLHSLAIREAQPVCMYCEPGDRSCVGYGKCHCGCGMSTAAEYEGDQLVPDKFIGKHHSRRVPVAG